MILSKHWDWSPTFKGLLGDISVHQLMTWDLMRLSVFDRTLDCDGMSSYVYYTPEVRRGKYWGLGVFPLQYFPIVKIWKPLHYKAEKLIYLGSKSNKHLRGSTQATIHPLAIILTAALWALVSMTAWGVLWSSYCLLCVSYNLHILLNCLITSVLLYVYCNTVICNPPCRPISKQFNTPIRSVWIPLRLEPRPKSYIGRLF